MAQDNLYSPQIQGRDLKVEGAVDRTDTTTQMRDGSRKGYPSLLLGDEAAALFNRLRSVFQGLDLDGYRMGDLIVAAGPALTNILTSLTNEVEDVVAFLELLRSDLNLQRPDVPKLEATLVDRINKFLGGKLSSLLEATEDGGGLLEVIDSRVSAGLKGLAQLVPLGNIYRSATASAEVTRSDPEWSHYNGPTQFLSIAAVVGNGTVAYVIPVLDYNTFVGQITWSNAGTSTQQFRIYGKLDDTAWVAVGSVSDYRDIKGRARLTDNSTPGWNTVMGSGGLSFEIQQANLYREIVIEQITTNTGGATTASGWYGLAGAGH